MTLTWRQLNLLAYLVKQAIDVRRHGLAVMKPHCSTAELETLRALLKAEMTDGALAVARRQDA